MSKELIKAAKEGDLKKVNELLKNPKIEKEAHAEGNAALLEAVKGGHTEVVKLLLKNENVRKNAAIAGKQELIAPKRKNHLTWMERLGGIPNIAFRESIKLGHLEIAKLLWEIPEIQKEAAANNNEALEWAIINNFPEIVKILLEKQEVKEKSAANRTEILILAVRNNNPEMVKLLVTVLEINDVEDDDDLYGHVANSYIANNEELLLCAIRTKNPEIIKLLENIMRKYYTCINNISRQIPIRTANQAEVDYESRKLLYCIINKGGLEILDCIVKMEIDGFNRQASRLGAIQAIRKNKLEILKYLVQHEFTPTLGLGGNDHLAAAASEGHIEIVKFLLTQHSVVYYLSSYHYSYMRCLSEGRRASGDRWETGRDRNQLWRDTPLEAAAQAGHKDIVYLLMELYHSLNIPPRRYMKVGNVPVANIFKHYQVKEKIKEAESILITSFSERGIAKIIIEYSALPLISEMLLSLTSNKNITEILPEPPPKEGYSHQIISILIDSFSERGIAKIIIEYSELPLTSEMLSYLTSKQEITEIFPEPEGLKLEENSHQTMLQTSGTIEPSPKGKIEQESLEKVQTLQTRETLESETTRDSSLLKIQKAFSVLLSKENFTTTSYCFTEKNVLQALSKQPTLKDFQEHIETLKDIGQIEEANFDSLVLFIAGLGEDNKQLMENVENFYNQQRKLYKELIDKHEEYSLPVEFTPIQQLFYHLHVIGAGEIYPDKEHRIESAISALRELQKTNHFTLDGTMIPWTERTLRQEINHTLKDQAFLVQAILASRTPQSVEESKESGEQENILKEDHRRKQANWLGRIEENAKKTSLANKGQIGTSIIPPNATPILFDYKPTVGFEPLPSQDLLDNKRMQRSKGLSDDPARCLF